MKKALIIFLVAVTFLLTGYSLVRRNSNGFTFPPPMLVIMYDDGAVEDYEVAFPVHQRHGVPGVVAANSSTLNTPHNLTVDQLKEMENAGWEVVNHGKYHAALDNRKVERKINRGDTKIHVHLPYRVKEQYEYLLYNQMTGREEVVDVVNIHVNHDNRKRGYLEIESGTENAYPVRGTYLRLTPGAAREEIVTGKKELLDLGFNVTNYTYSYNAYEDWSKEMVSRYHNASRSNTGGKLLFNRINREPLNRYALYSTNFEIDKISDEQINFLLGQTARNGGLTILWAHTWSDNFTRERLNRIIRLAKEKNIQIVTLEEAINIFSRKSQI